MVLFFILVSADHLSEGFSFFASIAHISLSVLLRPNMGPIPIIHVGTAAPGPSRRARVTSSLEPRDLPTRAPLVCNDIGSSDRIQAEKTRDVTRSIKAKGKTSVNYLNLST
ncbi:hypothetical protein F4776DRAFT_605385 [Hypoxylon sp. NC0597]|nr:hypothetical protein F4776DRAFT_605385 [Hypoxylon sp. NC0597]